MKDISLEPVMDEIKKRREANKESQTTIAKLIGVSLRTYQAYEAKRTTNDKPFTLDALSLVKLCAYFKIDLNTYLESGEIRDLVELRGVEKKMDELEERLTTKLDKSLEGFKREFMQEFMASLFKPKTDSQIESKKNEDEEDSNA